MTGLFNDNSAHRLVPTENILGCVFYLQLVRNAAKDLMWRDWDDGHYLGEEKFKRSQTELRPLLPEVNLEMGPGSRN